MIDFLSLFCLDKGTQDIFEVILAFAAVSKSKSSHKQAFT